jgi:hypothetical protein
MDAPNTQDSYQVATTMKQEGKTDYDIEQALLMKGLNQDEARKIIARASATTYSASGQAEEKKGNGMWGWAIWLVALGVINLLSYLFNWNFWIY